MTPLFENRREAGRALAEKLKSVLTDSNPLILALPRGGVPVAFEVALALHAPLDIFLVRKLGMPAEEELALGAIASGGVRVLNRDLIDYLHLPESVLDQITQREQRELERRETFYREGRPPIPVQGRAVVLVDDGLATGASMLAAARALRPQARRTVIAVPVAPRESCAELRSEADEIVCLATPEPFRAVGAWYADFRQTSDEDVRILLEAARQQPQTPPSSPSAE